MQDRKILKETLKKVGQQIVEHEELSKTVQTRGKNLFKKGYVVDLNILPNKVIATVVGTYPYTVVVRFEGDQLKDVFCSCPYDGYICKHIVAVGYQLIHNPFLEPFGFQNVPPEVVQKALVIPLLESDPHFKPLAAILEALYSEEKVYKHIFSRYISALEVSLNGGGLYFLSVLLNNLDLRTINVDNLNFFIRSLFENLHRYGFFGEFVNVIEAILLTVKSRFLPLLNEETLESIRDFERSYWGEEEELF